MNKLLKWAKVMIMQQVNLLDCEYFKDHFQLIAIDLNKQTELESFDLKQQINFIRRLEENMQHCSLLLRTKKKRILIFHKIL